LTVIELSIAQYLRVDVVGVLGGGEAHHAVVDRVAHHGEAQQGDHHEHQPQQVGRRERRGQLAHRRHHGNARHAHAAAQHQVETVAQTLQLVTGLQSQTHKNNPTVDKQIMHTIFYILLV